MELWDVYDADRQKTGKTMVRGEAFEEGAYHIVIHVCIFGPDGRMLIQRRQPFKEGWPDKWDVSVGGSAIAGETAGEAATRELGEELGLRIDLSGARPHLTVNFPQGFDDYFLVEKDVELSELKLQYEEVQDAKWATKDEILAMIADGTFIPFRTALIELLFDLCERMGAHTR